MRANPTRVSDVGFMGDKEDEVGLADVVTYGAKRSRTYNYFMLVSVCTSALFAGFLGQSSPLVVYSVKGICDFEGKVPSLSDW